MQSITLRNISDEVMGKIRLLSMLERRSMNNEMVILLEKGLEKEILGQKNISRTLQTEIFKKLSGKWEDNRSAKEISDDIISSRTLGRSVDL